MNGCEHLMNNDGSTTEWLPLARRSAALRAARAVAGFTLLELVIVILIVGIIAAAAQPRFAGALANYRVDAAAHRLAADLGYASSLARVSSRPVIIRFYSSGDGSLHYYRFDQLGDPHVPGRPADPSQASTWYTVWLNEDPYAAQWLEMPAMVEFDIYGLPDRDAQWVIRCGPRQRTVTCVRSTGKASVL